LTNKQTTLRDRSNAEIALPEFHQVTTVAIPKVQPQYRLNPGNTERLDAGGCQQNASHI
jgi:hypothetical protein